MGIPQLERNDTAGAASLYRSMLQAGTLTPADVESLLMLQDDPRDLMRAFAAMQPEMAEPVAAMEQRFAARWPT